MRRPSQTCIRSDTPSKFTFLQGLSPHPAWALTLMGLPSLYSTGSDTLRHKWVPFSPAWALTLRRADHGPPLMLSLPNSFWTKIFKTKGGMEGKGKGKTLCFILNMKEKLTLVVTLQTSKKRLPFLTFQTFELTPTSCLIIKSLISTKMPLSTLEYNFLKWYICVL